MKKNEYSIGIDLGTGNSVVAVQQTSGVEILNNIEGRRTTPSVVAFTGADIKVGDSAKRQAITNSTKTVNFVKRFMGRKFSEVSKEISMASYKVVDDKGIPKIDIDGKLYSPQEISAIILQKMKQSAEAFLGCEVKNAVITVPAYFNDSQRQATKEAGEIAGLNILRIVNEPTAAALAYGMDNKITKDKNIAVYDWGCGTLDTTFLTISSDGIFEVLSTAGDSLSGGIDIDKLLVDLISKTFQDENGIDLRKDPMALQRLFEAAEKAKIELSSSSSTEINLPYIMPVDGIPKHLVRTITRAEFERLISDLVDSTLIPLKKALEASKLKLESVDDLILVGGSTRIPLVQAVVEKFFGKAPSKSVNPDEAVAIGAAILANSLVSGGKQEILLLDVTPLSLSIETMGGISTVLVPQNTTVPTRKSQIFSTASDNQPGVEIHVLQGERSLAKDNRTLGRFTLDGILPAKKSVPQIEVSFDIDANGILNVSAIDKATNKSQHIKIEASSGLSDTEIARMKEEAAANADSDKKEKESIEKLNAADSLIFNTEKQLVELNDKLSEAHKSSISKPLNDLKDANKAKDLAKIDTATAELSGAWQAASEEMYKATTATEGENVKSEATEKEPVDVEFEQVK